MGYYFNENACQEAYTIVNYLIETSNIVVPQKIMSVLEIGRNINHSFDLNDISKRELHPDTEKILTEIYMECIATQSEKNKINKAIKTLNSTIASSNTKTQSTSIATVSWGDKFRQKLFSPVKIKI